MKWDNTLNLIVILLFVFSPLPARAENLIFQHAIAGDAFQAFPLRQGYGGLVAGRVIALYGVDPPAPADPNAYAATLYLDTVLAHASLDCRTVPGTPRMACKANGADVASELVQMGMGAAPGLSMRRNRWTRSATGAGCGTVTRSNKSVV
jgi:hypothetical protein